VFLNCLNEKFKFILFYILLIAQPTLGYDIVKNESSSNFSTTPEITTWDTDTESFYGQFIESPAIDNSEDFLVWKANRGRGYIIKSVTIIKNSVYLTFQHSHGNDVVCINMDSLTQKNFKIPEEIIDFSSPFFASSDKQDKILLSTSKRIRIFNQHYLEMENNLKVSLDCRIRPKLFENNLVFVEGYRGWSMVRIDLDGNHVWRCKLPGYVMSNPAVYGSIMIIQTRQESYGGQATTTVNLNNGEILWSETTNAYGHGVCFDDDAYYCFESDQFLNPQKTEGWIICRMANTGERKWEHIQRGGIQHRPVVDQNSNNVYAVFNKIVDSKRGGGENEVICFECDTGAICWRSKLTNPVKKPPSASYEEYWPALKLQGDMLMVLDEKDVLHFFDPKNGDLLLSLDLTPAKQIFSVPRREAVLIDMPLIIKDKLLVFTNLGFVSCPIK